jgi:hypothetical protein
MHFWLVQSVKYDPVRCLDCTIWTIASDMDSRCNCTLSKVYSMVSLRNDYNSQQLPFWISTILTTTLGDTREKKNAPAFDVAIPARPTFLQGKAKKNTHMHIYKPARTEHGGGLPSKYWSINSIYINNLSTTQQLRVRIVLVAWNEDTCIWIVLLSSCLLPWDVGNQQSQMDHHLEWMNGRCIT